MNHRERILATLQRHPVDQTPVDIWLTPEVLTAVQDHVGTADELEAYHRLGLDKIVWIFPGYGSEKFDPNDSQGRDPWGVPTRKVQSGHAVYQEFGEGPLAGVEEPEELDDYELWPEPEGFNFDGARALAETARSYDFATIGPWVSFFEIYCHLRGMENALMDVVSEPELLEAGLDRIEAIQTRVLERFLEGLGDLIDIVFISDDMGTQGSQLISIPAWRTHFQPRLKRWCDLIHSRGKRVLFHTDGAARDFVPHLIEAGVDILNPIQHICPGMEREALNRDFGEQLIFHGGVENQHVLPYGTVEEVREEVETCLKTLGRGGGYILSSCHNIQAGTPLENVLAMIETAQEKG